MDLIATVLEVCGLVCLVVAAWFVSAPLGLTAAGLALLLCGWSLGGRRFEADE